MSAVSTRGGLVFFTVFDRKKNNLASRPHRVLTPAGAPRPHAPRRARHVKLQLFAAFCRHARHFTDAAPCILAARPSRPHRVLTPVPLPAAFRLAAGRLQWLAKARPCPSDLAAGEPSKAAQPKDWASISAGSRKAAPARKSQAFPERFGSPGYSASPAVAGCWPFLARQRCF